LFSKLILKKSKVLLSDRPIINLNFPNFIDIRLHPPLKTAESIGWPDVYYEIALFFSDRLHKR